jgi:hypothetical protein
MELLKSNPIIDIKYKPSLDLTYIDYFNRSLAFAQTNYQEQLNKVSRTNFNKLSPTIFFEEYVWSIACINKEPKEVSEFFPELSKQLTPIFHSFWNLNDCPNLNDFKDTGNYLIHSDSIVACAKIITRGIKLFGWEYYRNNFLDTSEKLIALPYLNAERAKHLARNIGHTTNLISSFRLQDLANHWGFKNVETACRTIQQHVPLQLKIIELILWYAVATFEDNVIKS